MMKRAIVVLSLLIITAGVQFPRKSGFPVLEAPYLGQEPPGKTPKLFAPGIVSTKKFDEYGCTFSPDGKEFYFSRRKGPYDVTILVTKQSGQSWSDPVDASFVAGYDCVEPHYSASGNKIFFQSTAPLPSGWDLPYSKTRFKLWIVERVGEDWGKPYPLAKELSRGLHGQVSVAYNQTIYATFNSKEIVTLKYSDGEYQGATPYDSPLL